MLYAVEADYLVTRMSDKINNKMEHRMIKEQHLVLLASIEVNHALNMLSSDICRWFHS